SGLISEADPVRGYTVILMQHFKPGEGKEQPGLPPNAEVAILRYGADLAPVKDARERITVSLFGQWIASIKLPFGRRVDLKEEPEWRGMEEGPMMPRPMEVVYPAAGRAKEGSRPCLKVEGKLAQPLPLYVELFSYSLTGFDHTLCVDPVRGQALSHRLHISQKFSQSQASGTQEFEVALTLQETRKLSQVELASRVKQAEAIDRLQS